MEAAVLESASATERAAAHYLKTSTLAVASDRLERAARYLFDQQRFDVLHAFYSLPMLEADNDDDDAVAATIAAIAAVLARRLNDDIALVTPAMRDALSSAITRAGLAKYGVTVNLADIRAEQWLAEHGAELVRGLNEWTTTQLRTLLTEAVARGDNVASIAEQIVSKFSQMTPYRAETIAMTETSKAYSWAETQQARLLEEAGIVMMKQWLLSPLHEIYDPCDHNFEAGPVPLEDIFPAGDFAPPQHPRCRCILTTFPAKQTPDGTYRVLGTGIAVAGGYFLFGGYDDERGE